MNENLISIIEKFNRNVVMTLTTKDKGFYTLQATALIDEALLEELNLLQIKWNFYLSEGAQFNIRIKSECKDCGEYFILRSPYIKEATYDGDGAYTINFVTPVMLREFDCTDCEDEKGAKTI